MVLDILNCALVSNEMALDILNYALPTLTEVDTEGKWENVYALALALSGMADVAEA